MERTAFPQLSIGGLRYATHDASSASRLDSMDSDTSVAPHCINISPHHVPSHAASTRITAAQQNRGRVMASTQAHTHDGIAEDSDEDAGTKQVHASHHRIRRFTDMLPGGFPPSQQRLERAREHASPIHQRRPGHCCASLTFMPRPDVLSDRCHGAPVCRGHQACLA